MTRSHRLPMLSLVQLSFRPSANDLGNRVLRGAGFAFAGVGFRTAVTLGSLSVLARLLSPSDFGEIAMATVVTELAAVFANFGFGSVLIQRLKLARIHLDTMFWASAALGLVLMVTVMLFSFAAQTFFRSPTTGELLRVLSVSLLVDQLAVIPRSTLARLMLFRRDFAVQSVAMLVRAAVAIALAASGAGVWSLVWGALAGVLAQAALYSLAVPYVPRLRFDLGFLRSSWKVNAGYFGSGILFYINSNADIILVGRLLGSTPLGYYQNARSLTDEIRARIAVPLQRVLFPAFATLQNDVGRLQNAVLGSTRMLAAFLVPIGFGISALADELVPVLYGTQWTAMIPVLKIIAASAGIRAATSVASAIYAATNRVLLSMYLNILGAIVIVTLFVAGSHWGLIGIAVAQACVAVIALLMFRVALGLVELRTITLLQIFWAPCLASVTLWGAIALTRPYLESAIESVTLRGAILAVLGVLVYGGTLLSTSRAHARNLRDLLSRVWGRQ